ncbi:MAG: hypothetical protein HY262_08680 [Chloroflexi bacterium]|nr:hypothetical protein [Chloroflexota bacterium]
MLDRFDPAIDEYLDELEAALDLPAFERADVRDEIAAHLRDARAEAIDAGATDETVDAHLLRTFGDPKDLARDLTRARQARSTLLAAAGAGTWAAAGAAFRGYVLGIALLATVLVAIGVVVAMAFRAGLIGTWSLADQGWITAIGGVAVWFAAWQGSRTLVAVFAQRSHHRVERVRPFVGATAGLVTGWLALVWFRAPQNLGSVVVLAVVPALVVAGTLTGPDREIVRTKAARRASLALFVTVLVTVPLLMISAGTGVSQGSLTSVGPRPFASMEELQASLGLDMPGRYVADPPTLAFQSWGLDHGVANVEIRDAAVVSARWRNIRVEAWRPDLTDGSLDRAYPTPFAIGPMSAGPSDSLVGSVRVDRTRDVSGFWLVVTGTAVDGGRDLIVSLGGTNVTFTGSALDWLTAP